MKARYFAMQFVPSAMQMEAINVGIVVWTQADDPKHDGDGRVVVKVDGYVARASLVFGLNHEEEFRLRDEVASVANRIREMTDLATIERYRLESAGRVRLTPPRETRPCSCDELFYELVVADWREHEETTT